MGTVGILRVLLRYWSLTSHPIFQAETRRYALVQVSRWTGRILGQIWRPVIALLALLVILALADFLCGGTTHPITNAVISMFSVGGGTLALLSILLLTYLWPLNVAVAASGVIAQERERQTWDVLLTTPLEWSEIVLVKLAAALKRFNPYSEVFLWVQVFLLAIIFVLVVGRPGVGEVNTSPGIVIPLVIITVAEFAIARAQDYVIAGLLGLLASLQSTTRQNANLVALMLGAAMVLLRAMITGFIMGVQIPVSLPGALILISTGPSSVIALAFHGPIAIMILLSMIVIRETVIRVLFTWLMRHLGEASPLTA